MKINKTIITLIKKGLPKRYFNYYKRFWHKNIKPVLEYKKTKKLRSFDNETVIEAHHTQSDTKFKIKLKKDNGLVDQTFLLEKIHDPGIFSVIHSILKEGDVFVDIGTNIGGHMLFAAKCVGSSGNVYAFEPIKNIFEQANESIALNGFNNIELKNVALGNREEELKIYIDSSNRGFSSLVFKERGDEFEVVKVEIADEMLSDIQAEIKLVKIDVEGFEYNVLLGMEETFLKNKPKNIILEFSPMFYDTIDPSISLKILNLLKYNNYKLFDIGDGDRHEEIELNKFELFIQEINKQRQGQINILCVLQNL